MIPAGEDDPAVAVDDRGVCATGGVVEDGQAAAGRIKPVDAGDGRRAFVLVQVRIQVGFPEARAVRGEQDVAVAGVERGDVGVVRRMPCDPGGGRGLATYESGELV